MMEPVSQPHKGSALLGRQHIRHVGDCLHDTRRGRLRQLELGSAQLLQCDPVHRRLRQTFDEGLPILVMLLSDRGNILQRAGNDGLHLLTLLLAGVYPAEHPVRGELKPLACGFGREGAAAVPAVAAPSTRPSDTKREGRDTGCQHASREAPRQEAREEGPASAAGRLG